MSSKRAHRKVSALLLSLALALAACGGQPTTATQAAPTDAPAADDDDELDEFGPGDFDLLDPAVGLADLDAYRAELLTTFDALVDGERARRERASHYAATRNPPQWTLTLEADDDDERSVLAEVAGVIYRVSADGHCEMLLPGRRPLEARQPAAILPSVIGAEESGRETVNGVEATRYTFDARATTYGDEAVAEGQLWVAVQGGYVLRYELTVSGVIGDEVDGVVTWSYSLEPTGAVVLPPECALVAVDAPLPDDATRILRGAGVVMFETQLGIAEVAALYADGLPPLGWTLESREDLEGAVLVDYLRGEQRLTLTAHAMEEGGAEVSLVMHRAEE